MCVRGPRSKAWVLPLDDEIPVEKVCKHWVCNCAVDQESCELAVILALVPERLHKLQEVSHKLVVSRV